MEKKSWLEGGRHLGTEGSKKGRKVSPVTAGTVGDERWHGLTS